MSLPRYPEYREAGIPWLEKVPAHWKLRKIKHFAQFSGGGTPSRDNPAFWNGEIPWVSPKDMKSERLYASEESITQAGLAGSASSMVPAGTLLMVVRSGILKHTIPVAINMVPVALNQDMKAVRPKGASAEYLQRWIQGLNDRLLLVWSKQGATVESIEHDYLAETQVPLPPEPEQSAIAAFLDRETAKIDALIAEQQKLIALLAEKRQATISHAVTKGPNPDAPMKDSGVPWLGEVPAHWEVSALKRFWSVTDCKHITAEFVEEGFPLASIREVQSRFVRLDDAKRTTQHFYEQLSDGGRMPRAGDLIFSRNATVGEVAQVCDSHPAFAMGQDVCLLRKLSKDFSSDFLQLVIKSRVVIEQLGNIMVGSTFKRVNVEDIRALTIAVPPSNEQATIAELAIAETEKLDQLNVTALSGIALLQERRSALIAAAVTGQIDVRDAVDAKAA